MSEPLENDVDAAKAGNKDALDRVVTNIQDRVHHLAMRILVDPEDAKEATQEILILVVTKLALFDGRSKFETWVYRVSVNYLISAKRARNRAPGLTFEAFREDLHDGLVADTGMSAEDTVMLNELRVSCTMALLLCLEIDQRVAYVLGDILQLGHEEAAATMSISAAAYRKRLSRARAAIVDFTSRQCGIVAKSARCTCPKRLPAALKLGRVAPGRQTFSRDSPGYDAVIDQVKALEGELAVLALQGATSDFKAPSGLGLRLTQILDRR